MTSSHHHVTLALVLTFFGTRAVGDRICFSDDECPLPGDEPDDVLCCAHNECCDYDPTKTLGLGIGALVGIIVASIVVLSAVILISVCCCACCRRPQIIAQHHMQQPMTTNVTLTPSSQASDQVNIYSSPSEAAYYNTNGYAVSMHPSKCPTSTYHPQGQDKPTGRRQSYNNSSTENKYSHVKYNLHVNEDCS